VAAASVDNRTTLCVCGELVAVPHIDHPHSSTVSLYSQPRIHEVDLGQVNRDGEPMRATKYQFEILPQRLQLHLPNTKLLTRHKDRGSLSDTSSNSGQTVFHHISSLLSCTVLFFPVLNLSNHGNGYKACFRNPLRRVGKMASV